MKTIFSLIMVFGLLSISIAIGSTAKKDINKNSRDEAFKKKIIGKWSEGESPYGISSFEVGGVYMAWMYEDSRKEKLLCTIKGKWWIENGKLYNTASEITPPILGLKVGEVVVDRIVDIADDVMTLIDDEGNQYTNKRIKK